jgi:hypothetical protein
MIEKMSLNMLRAMKSTSNIDTKNNELYLIYVILKNAFKYQPKNDSLLS